VKRVVLAGGVVVEVEHKGRVLVALLHVASCVGTDGNRSTPSARVSRPRRRGSQDAKDNVMHIMQVILIKKRKHLLQHGTF
jgi:hypothetical protein